MKRMNSGNKFNNIRLQAMSQLLSFFTKRPSIFFTVRKKFRNEKY